MDSLSIQLLAGKQQRTCEEQLRRQERHKRTWAEELCRGSEAVEPAYRGSESAMGDAWWMNLLLGCPALPGRDVVLMAGCA